MAGVACGELRGKDEMGVSGSLDKLVARFGTEALSRSMGRTFSAFEFSESVLNLVMLRGIRFCEKSAEAES